MEAKKKRAEPTTPPPPSPLPASAAASVLGTDDLLREILLRLGFPTCLVRAAAVCKRWLRHASDPAFLRRFRELRPPRPLGFYIITYCNRAFPRFVPLPQPPELSSVIRRGSFELRGHEGVLDCRDGRLIISINGRSAVRSPLHPRRAIMTLLPEPQLPSFTEVNIVRPTEVLFSEDRGGSMPYIAVTFIRKGLMLRVHLSKMQGESWDEGRILDLIELPERSRTWLKLCLVAYGKLYLICVAGYIIGLDLPSTSLFSIKMPEGVDFVNQANLRLSRADASGFYLIYAKGFQIRVWLYRTDIVSNGNWKLVDIICLLQVFGPLTDPSWPPGVAVHVDAVGDNADFVFLRIHFEVFYMRISSRTVEKVYDLRQDYKQARYFVGIHPFLMVCAPTFLVLNNAHDQEE